LGQVIDITKVWEWVEEKITPEDVNKLLLAMDKEGITVLHVAAQWGNLNTLQKV